MEIHPRMANADKLACTAKKRKRIPRAGALRVTIVNTSSVNGLGGASGASLHAMAKAGVLALTKSAAQEYAKDGIRVNALVAGGFDTDMLRSAVKQIVGDDPVRIAECLKWYAAVFPLSVLEVCSKLLKRLFGYVAAPLRM